MNADNARLMSPPSRQLESNDSWMKPSRRPGPLSKSMEMPFTLALVPAYSVGKHCTSIGRPFAGGGDLKMPHPSAALPVGLALLGEGLRAFDRVLTARHGDEG